jgi:hypothetical protein
MYIYIYIHTHTHTHTYIWSRDSSVGIATRYGLDGPGIESRWAEIFRTYPDRLRGPPSLLYNGYRVFPGGKGGRGVILTTHPLLVPRLRKSWAIPPLTLWVLLGLLRGSLYLLHKHILIFTSDRGGTFRFKVDKLYQHFCCFFNRFLRHQEKKIFWNYFARKKTMTHPS